MYLSDKSYKSKHEITKVVDGYVKKVCVYEVSNGFIVKIEKMKDSKAGEEYEEPMVEYYISKTNPLQSVKSKEDNVKSLADIIDVTY